MSPRNFLEALGQTLSGFGQQVPGILQRDVGIRQGAERSRLRQAADQARLTETQRRNRLSGEQGAERLKISQGQLELALARLAETQRRNEALEGQFTSRETRLSQPTPQRGPTGAQRLGATEDVFEEQQLGTLGEASRRSLELGGGPIGSIEELEEQAARPRGGFLGFRQDPPDTALTRLRDQFLQIGSPAHRRAFQAGDSLQTLRPSLFPQGQQQPIQPFTPGTDSVNVSQAEAMDELRRRGLL